MPIESAADRAVFLNPDEFGSLGSYTLAAGGAALDIAGQFDDPSTVGGVSEMGVGTLDARPTFFCAEADLPPGADGDAGDLFAVAARSFVVTSIEPDGQGMALIRLGAAS